MRILGVRGEFAPTGSAAFLLEHFGLTADGIAAAARELARRMAPLSRCVLAIDQGTSATKALLVDARGAIVAPRRARRSARRIPRPGLGRAGRRRDLAQRPGGRRATASTAATPRASPPSG